MDIVQLMTEVLGLSIFIFTAVEQLKQFKVEGQALTFSAFGVGLVIGGLYRYFVYSPSTGLEWFALVIFGLTGGFIATRVYKGIESASGKNSPAKWYESGE